MYITITEKKNETKPNIQKTTKYNKRKNRYKTIIVVYIVSKQQKYKTNKKLFLIGRPYSLRMITYDNRKVIDFFSMILLGM